MHSRSGEQSIIHSNDAQIQLERHQRTRERVRSPSCAIAQKPCGSMRKASSSPGQLRAGPRSASVEAACRLCTGYVRPRLARTGAGVANEANDVESGGWEVRGGDRVRMDARIDVRNWVSLHAPMRASTADGLNMRRCTKTARRREPGGDRAAHSWPITPAWHGAERTFRLKQGCRTRPTRQGSRPHESPPARWPCRMFNVSLAGDLGQPGDRVHHRGVRAGPDGSSGSPPPAGIAAISSAIRPLR